MYLCGNNNLKYNTMIMKSQLEKLDNDEKVLLNLFAPKEENKIEKKVINLSDYNNDIIVNKVKEKKIDKFAKSFDNFDMDFEVPSDLSFMEDNLKKEVKKVTTDVITPSFKKDELKVVFESILNEVKTLEDLSEIEALYNKLKRIEQSAGREYAIKYLSGYIEYKLEKDTAFADLYSETRKFTLSSAV